ncbi:MAG: hypothetical protein K2H76_07310 [Muribaculaceae bacterium]|nr:hypothetical protein [Muribaculaceae bacterium]
MKKLPYILASSLAFIILFSLPSCKGWKKGIEKGEETQAEIEAAMMDGRSAAREFINKRWTDTIELQNHLLEARTKRIPYDTVDKPHCRAAFDSAFVSTIRTVRPDIAKALQK